MPVSPSLAFQLQLTCITDSLMAGLPTRGSTASSAAPLLMSVKSLSMSVVTPGCRTCSMSKEARIRNVSMMARSGSGAAVMPGEEQGNGPGLKR